MTSRLLFLVCVVLCFIEVFSSQTDEKCTRLESQADLRTTTIRKKLLCNYDAYTPPKNDTLGNRVSVRVILGRYRINFLSKLSSISDGVRNFLPKKSVQANSPNWFMMTTYIVMSWKDQRLKWEKADYKNQTRVQFRRFEIWQPYVIPFFYRGHGVYATDDGKVWSVFLADIIGNCRPISYSWGVQRECTVHFRVLPDSNVQLSNTMTADFHVSNSASWGVVKAERTFPLKPETKNDEFFKINEQMPWKYGSGYFESKVVIQKNFAVTDATIFAPAAILLILLVSSTLIPAKDECRVAMLSVIVVVQVFMFHQACQAMPFFEQGIVINIVELYQNLVLCSGLATLEWLIAFIIGNRKDVSVVETTFSRTSMFSTLRTVLAIPAQVNGYFLDERFSDAVISSCVLGDYRGNKSNIYPGNTCSTNFKFSMN